MNRSKEKHFGSTVERFSSEKAPHNGIGPGDYEVTKPPRTRNARCPVFDSKVKRFTKVKIPRRRRRSPQLKETKAKRPQTSKSTAFNTSTKRFTDSQASTPGPGAYKSKPRKNQLVHNNSYIFSSKVARQPYSNLMKRPAKSPAVGEYDTLSHSMSRGPEDR